MNSPVVNFVLYKVIWQNKTERRKNSRIGEQWVRFSPFPFTQT